MKCKCCGANVTIEDEFCPYCGALNEPARKHIEDMKRYAKDYSDTRKEVMSNAEKQSRHHSVILILALLVFANVITLAATLNVDDVSYMIEELSVHAHAAEYKKQLDAYEAEGNCLMLQKLYYQKDLYEDESLREYSSAADIAGNYVKIANDCYYLTAGGGYQTKGQLIEALSREITDFYYSLSLSSREYYRERFTGQHLSFIEDTTEKIKLLLRTELGLTAEEIEALPDMEEQNIMLLIGKKVGYYE